MVNSAMMHCQDETAVEPVEYRGRFNPLNHPISFVYPSRIAVSSWIEHVPFGMYLIDVLRPKALIELGTHYGVSYCAFCQAVKELGVDTRCYAVDSWHGDAQTGFYGPEVLADLKEHHDPIYGGFSRLIEGTFDEALAYFADRNFDLMHIDGFHSYDAVKQDFEKWLPKLTDRAVVLFHDINVRERGFGVWKLWEELKPRFPHFEFVHMHGLGVLAVGERYPDELNELFKSSEEEAKRIRSFFASLGARLEVAKELQLTKAAHTQLLAELHQQLADRDQQLAHKDQQLADKDQQLAHKDQQLAHLADKDQQLTDKVQQLADKDQSILAQDLQVKELEKCLRSKDLRLEEMEKGIRVHLQSHSYRLGRALTWPLRSLTRLFR
ncbi:MAG: class I SAM-dependent methyltransferase [Acidobacteriota bacterium]